MARPASCPIPGLTEHARRFVQELVECLRGCGDSLDALRTQRVLFGADEDEGVEQAGVLALPRRLDRERRFADTADAVDEHTPGAIFRAEGAQRDLEVTLPPEEGRPPGQVVGDLRRERLYQAGRDWRVSKPFCKLDEDVLQVLDQESFEAVGLLELVVEARMRAFRCVELGEELLDARVLLGVEHLRRDGPDAPIHHDAWPSGLLPQPICALELLFGAAEITAAADGIDRVRRRPETVPEDADEDVPVGGLLLVEDDLLRPAHAGRDGAPVGDVDDDVL